MHCNHRCYECHIPACPDRIRQSIGPRIVPMFADPPEWSADKVYSPLTLVIHNGATYMSRRCVPANTALPDTDPFYNESWVMVYDMNAQVAQYREEVAQLSQQVTDFGGKIDNWEQLIVQWTALIQGWQNQFPELTKDLAAITERVTAIEPKLAQAQEDIAALQAMQQTHTEQIAANTQGLADLTPRVAAAETHLSALDEEQKVQDEHLNNLDASQTEQDTRIQANHDLAVQAKTTADNNTQQITENAGKIAANAAEIAQHAEQLEALKAADTALDGKISQNTAAIAQNTADIAQAKTDIKQAAAAAQQAQDTATHADAAASQAQTTADAAQEAAQAAQSAADQAKADNTTQDGRLDSLEAAQQQTAQDVANLKDGSTELPYVKKENGNATGTLAVENISVSGTATVGEPVNDTDAASKKYVDQAVQNATGGITPDVSKLKQDVAALQESQGTQDSQISAAAQTAQTAQETAQAAKTAADQAAQDVASIKNGSTALPYIKDTGDTVTGDYDFTGATVNVAAPTEDANAANKKYVDDADAVLNAAIQAETKNRETAITGVLQQIGELETGIEGDLAGYLPLTGGTMTGNINMTGHTIVNLPQKPTNGGDATSKIYVDNAIRGLTDGTTAMPYVKDTGDTVTGDYDFTGGTVQVAEPTRPADAATKQYVDTAVGQATDPALTARVEALETSQTQQDTQIEAAKNAANQAQTAAQTAQEAAEAAQSTASQANSTAQAAQTTANQAKADNTTQDGRLDALEEEQSTQAEQIAALQSQIGSGGVHGNAVLTDAIYIDNTTAVTVSKAASDIIAVTVYADMPDSPSSIPTLTAAATYVWHNTKPSVGSITMRGGLVIENISDTSVTFRPSQYGSNQCIITLQKFIAK